MTNLVVPPSPQQETLLRFLARWVILPTFGLTLLCLLFTFYFIQQSMPENAALYSRFALYSSGITVIATLVGFASSVLMHRNGSASS